MPARAAARERGPQGDWRKPKAGRPKAYVFKFKPPSKAFNLQLSFRKGHVARDEIIDALESILSELRRN